MKSYNNSKNAMWFFYTTPIYVLIVMGFLFIGVSNMEKSIYDKDFEMLKLIDYSNTVSNIENQFIGTFVDNDVKNFKTNFKEELIIDEKNLFLLDRLQYISCKNINEKIILYNEKLIDETIKSNLSEISCLKDNLEIENSFNIYVQNKLNNGLESFYNAFNIANLENISLGEISNSTKKNILIKSQFEEENSLGLIEKVNEYEYEYDFGLYPLLVKTVISVLPELSQDIKSTINACRETEEYKKLGKNEDSYCNKNALIKLLNDENELVLKNYDLHVKIVENLDIGNYYILEISFINKKTNENELEFQIVLRNNLPLDVVDYSINNHKFANNVIAMQIREIQDLRIDAKNFVILYSYEDFFNKNIYGLDRYNKLIDLLDKSKVPEDFTKTFNTSFEVEVSESPLSENFEKKIDAKIDYYISDDTLKLNLLVLSANDGFDAISKLKTEDIFQIYDFSKKEYETLIEKELYFSVFAVDPNGYSYFTDEELLKKAYNRITPKRVLGPSPLSNGNFESISSNINDLEESISIEFDTNQVEENIEFYDIYLTSDTINDFRKENDETHFYTRIDKSRISNKVLLTSSMQIFNNPHLIEFDKILVDSFKLDSNKLFRLNIIPLDSNFNGFTSNSLSYHVEKVGDHYELKEGDSNQVFFKDLKVVDNYLIKSIPNDLIISLDVSDTGYKLNWNYEKYNLEKISLTFEILKQDGGIRYEDKIFTKNLSNQIINAQNGDSFRIYNVRLYHKNNIIASNTLFSTKEEAININ